MRKTSIVFLTLLEVATVAWADDPCKQKSYKDWNENDVRQIMTDSPWAKKVAIAFDVTPNIRLCPRPQAAVAGPRPGVGVAIQALPLVRRATCQFSAVARQVSSSSGLRP